MTIDWTKPLELIDGTPVKLRESEEQGDPDYYVVREDGKDVTSLQSGLVGPVPCIVVTPDGRCWAAPTDIIVRNRAEHPAQSTLVEIAQLTESEARDLWVDLGGLRDSAVANMFVRGLDRIGLILAEQDPIAQFIAAYPSYDPELVREVFAEVQKNVT